MLKLQALKIFLMERINLVPRIICILVAFICLILGLGQLACLMESVSTKAEIIQVSTVQNFVGKQYLEYTVAYMVNDKEFVNTFKPLALTQYKSGDFVDIRYSRSNPNKIVLPYEFFGFMTVSNLASMISYFLPSKFILIRNA